MQNNIISFCKNKNINSFEELLNKLQTKTTLWIEFINIITINETYFFREKNQIIKALIKHNKTTSPLNILCAPSSTGEEVYSIVILIIEMKITNFKVTGIDISTEAIKKAKIGIYNERSVHKISPNILNKYFHISNNKYKVKDLLKKYTNFIECNLFEDKIYHIGKFDLIFSRNMFIYFKDEIKIKAYKRISALKKDTYSNIYLGHADVSSKLQNYIRMKK